MNPFFDEFLNDSIIFRRLNQEEISEMVTRHVFCANWEKTFVGPEFSTKAFWSVVLSGTNFLNTTPDSEIHQSRIENSRLDSCKIHQSIVQSSFVKSQCSIIQSNLGKESGLWGFDARLNPGDESRKPVYLTLQSTWNEVLKTLFLSDFSSFTADTEKLTYSNFLKSGSSLINTSDARNVLLDENCCVESAASLRQISLLTREKPCRVSTGSVLFRSVLEGCTAENLAQIHDSRCFNGGTFTDGVLIKNSVLGPGVQAGCGEINSTLLGGGVGFHHRSLLIAATWISGLGNIASGAQIGSNHTSRAPDATATISEGWFFGLGSLVKYPINLEDAPFGILAAGEILPSCVLVFPFSLIGSENGTPLIRPAWVLGKNLYSVIRNEKKWRERVPEHERYIVFRKETVEKMGKARRILGELGGKTQYSEIDHESLKGLILFEKHRLQALEWYDLYIKWGYSLPGRENLILESHIQAQILAEIQKNNTKVDLEAEPVLSYFKHKFSL